MRANTVGVFHLVAEGIADALAINAREDGAALEAAGGHLVLTRSREPGEAPKVPLWRLWQERPATAEVAEAHLFGPDAGVGIIPASIRSVVADLDAGDRRELWAEVGLPYEWLQTRRGSHSFYDQLLDPVTRRRFEVGGCTGEIIGDRAYVLFHSRESIRKLAAALPRRGTAPLQGELFPPEEVEGPAKHNQRRGRGAGRDPDAHGLGAG